MSFAVYILYSKTIDQYYVEHSGDLDDRTFRHTNSGSKSTKKEMIGRYCTQNTIKQKVRLIKEKWK